MKNTPSYIDVVLSSYSHTTRDNAMPSTVELKGLADVSNMLSEVAPKAAKSYISKCAKPATQVVLDAMKETVPVGVGILEELLVSKSHWEQDGATERLVVEIGPTKQAYWGMFQEFGTSKLEGKHWMGNAFEGCKEEVLEVFMEGIHDLTARLIARDMSEAIIEDEENYPKLPARKRTK